MVPCHGDPSHSNVRGNPARLLDFDRSGIGPPEYDLQRLLWHEAAIAGHGAGWFVEFWHDLTTAYAVLAARALDRERLTALYRLDVTKAVAWLALSSADGRRADQRRHAAFLGRLRPIVLSGLAESMFPRLH
jgi:aminoglycoside phosphotransferase (APT) family kinase protein